MLNKTKIDYYEKGGMQKDFYSEKDVVYIPCPFCSYGDYKEIYKERAVLKVVRCLNCSLIYVNPRLKNPEKIYWGDPNKYFVEARLIFEGKAKHHRDQNYIEDLKLIHKYKNKGNFLDIGTNMGFFLRNARDWQWNLYGLEPSPSLSEMARKYFGLNIKTAFISDAGFKDNFFDVVTMTDVFEHISKPHKVLKEIYRISKSDAILFIKIPNGLFNLFKFYMAKMTGRLRNYDLFDSYEHIIHYTDRTIRKMLKKNNFKIIKIAIGRPIQTPVWHNYLGQYYQYPCPWVLDPLRQSLRTFFYFLSVIEYWIRFKRIGYFASNIIVIARKN